MRGLSILVCAALAASLAISARAETLEAAKQDSGAAFGEFLSAAVAPRVPVYAAERDPSSGAERPASAGRPNLRRESGAPPGPSAPAGPRKRWSALAGAAAAIPAAWAGIFVGTLLVGGPVSLAAGLLAGAAAGALAGAGLGRVRGARGRQLRGHALAGAAAGLASSVLAVGGLAVAILYTLAHGGLG